MSVLKFSVMDILLITNGPWKILGFKALFEVVLLCVTIELKAALFTMSD